jgi:adenosine deaminase
VRVPHHVLRDARRATALECEPSALATTLEQVWRLPKVELHLHLEGTLRPETVCELAARYEPGSPLCRPDWWSSYWTFRDLSGFVLEFGRVLRTCIRSADDYYRVAAECFQDLAAQHVVYAEVSVGPRTPGRPYYVSLQDTVAAIDQARREAEARTSLRAGIIIGIARDRVAEHELGAAELAGQFVREAIHMRDRGAAIAGIDLHGDEQAVPQVEPFVPAFRAAAEAGLGLRAHAGEAAGPRSVWDALRHLAVRRIAHGVRSGEDPALVAYLARAGVALDMCPTSNVLTGAARSLAAHPIRALHDAGIPVTVSSDDPLVFHTTITAELAILRHFLRFSLDDLGRLTAQAAACAFLPEAQRAALTRTVRSAWSV